MVNGWAVAVTGFSGVPLDDKREKFAVVAVVRVLLVAVGCAFMILGTECAVLAALPNEVEASLVGVL